MKLSFSVEDLLHVYIIVWPKKKASTPFFKGNYYLCLKNLLQPQKRLVTNNPNKDLFLNEFVWVLGNWEFRAGDNVYYASTDAYFYCYANFNDKFRRRSEECKKAIQDVNNRQALRNVDNLLVYELIYRHVIPHKAEELSRIRFLRCASKNKLRSATPSTWKGLGLSSARTIHSPEFKVGKRASPQAYRAIFLQIPQILNQKFQPYQSLFRARTMSIPTISPTLPCSPWERLGLSSSEAQLLDKCKGKEHVEGRPSKKSKKNEGEMSSALLPSLDANTELWKPKFSIAELGKQVTVANTAKDHDISLALARASLQRIAVISDLMKEESIELKRTKKKNEASAAGVQRDKALKDLTELQVTVYEWVFNRGISGVGDNHDKQVAKLCPGIFMEGWLACLTKLGIPEDNQHGTRLLLQRSDGEEASATETAQPIGEIAVEEAGKTTTEEAGKDTAQDPPPEL
ncbi:hypothetical protein Acr_14g0006600 [Actinidia rufa]|uniref:Uncharacterized protein n=1 Tax=Actinidia rufa TaxID=165716 RepID=A0A7J0FQN0_9ERIC|nr:hypothetical protein Acr_14g0006600 [Actinidia rufa]